MATQLYPAQNFEPCQELNKKNPFKEYLCYLRYTAVFRNFVLHILSVKAYRGPIPKGARSSARIPLVSQRQREIH